MKFKFYYTGCSVDDTAVQEVVVREKISRKYGTNFVHFRLVFEKIDLC